MILTFRRVILDHNIGELQEYCHSLFSTGFTFKTSIIMLVHDARRARCTIRIVDRTRVCSLECSSTAIHHRRRISTRRALKLHECMSVQDDQAREIGNRRVFASKPGNASKPENGPPAMSTPYHTGKAISTFGNYRSEIVASTVRRHSDETLLRATF